jgi:hypothetical protein
MEFENKKLRDVADVAARIMMGEKALHPNQQKLDVHEPEKNELTAKDFEMLRNKKKVKEETEETIEEGTPAKNTDVADKSYLKDMGKKPTVASDLKNLGRFITGKKETNEEVEQIDETPGAQAMKASGVKQSPDKLLARTGMNIAHKFPRKGQTDLGNIPGMNTPNVSKDTADYAEKRRGDREKQLKPAIKAALGTHGPKSKLPEEVDQAAEFVLEYESKDGKFVHRARPGAYGGTKDEKHAVDTLSGPKTKELKAIESEKKKKMSEMVATYKEQGLKGLFEALKKDEVIVEEPTSAEFDAQLADAKQRAAGTKKQAEVSKPAVQAVQNEETHTTVEFIDYNDVNGVKISEIDLEERSMTKPEMKKKEKIVKSMKKSISGFKARYGDDAKSVMYATATKQAMKD